MGMLFLANVIWIREGVPVENVGHSMPGIPMRLTRFLLTLVTLAACGPGPASREQSTVPVVVPPEPEPPEELALPALPDIETQTWAEPVACSFDVSRRYGFRLHVGAMPFAMLMADSGEAEVRVLVRPAEEALHVRVRSQGVSLEGSSPASAYPLHLREAPELTPVAGLGPSTRVHPIGEAEGVIRFVPSIPENLTLVNDVSPLSLRCDELQQDYVEGGAFQSLWDQNSEARFLQGRAAIRSRRRGPIEAHYEASAQTQVRLLERRGRQRRVAFLVGSEGETGFTSLRVTGWVDAANVAPIPEDGGGAGGLFGTGRGGGGGTGPSERFSCREVQRVIARLPDGRHFAVGELAPETRFWLIGQEGPLVHVRLSGVHEEGGAQLMLPYSTFAACRQNGETPAL